MAGQQIKQLPEITTTTTSDRVPVQKASNDQTSYATLENLIPASSVGSEKLKTTVAFSAISSQSIATGSPTTVTSFTELADTGSNFASGKFTAPYDGVYNISGHAQFNDIGADNRVIAWLNFRTSGGTTKHIYRVEGVGRSGTHDTGVAINVTYPMNATDYVELQVFQESGGARTLQANTFSGFLVGRT